MNDDLAGLGSRDLFRIGMAALDEGNHGEAQACLRRLLGLDRQKALKRAEDLRALLQSSTSNRFHTTGFRRGQVERSSRSTSSCHRARCHDPALDGGHAHRDHARDIWSRIAEDVREIVDVANVQRAGRTAYPERRLLQLLSQRGLSFLSILHWAQGRVEADRSETTVLELLRRFSRRVVNDPDDRGGTGSFAGDFHAIYVAWVPLRGGSLRNFSFKQTPASDPRDRPWPAQAPQFKTVHLRCSLSRREAGDLVLEQIRSQKEYYASTRGR